jgi:D-alanyl-D-alanine carboxypeptidase
VNEAAGPENPVTPEVNNEKLFSDFEKQNFDALFRKSSSTLSRRIGLLASSFLAFTVLLLAAYYSSKILIYKYDYIDSAVYSDTLPAVPLDHAQTIFDTHFTAMDQTDDYSSKSVFVYDLTSNRPIFTKNSEQKTLIASLTKLSSSLVSIRSVDLDRETEITEELEEINGSSLHMKKGEKYTNLDLIKASVIISSNQGAYAVNDPDDTVRKMNKLADVLGLANTRFANPAGFDDEGNYSTAVEYLQIAKLFFRDARLKEYASTIRTDITEKSENKSVRISNTNDLIRLGTRYVVAGKTGTTPKAGQNLMLLIEKNGRQYIVFLLNGADRYKDAYKVLDRIP